QEDSVRSRLRTCSVVACLAVLLWSTAVSAQTLTGQIGGSVLDEQGAAVPGATVTVTNTATRASREVTTDAQGAFVVTGLLAGTYDLRVVLTGFRTYEQRGVDLSATERLALPPIMLQLGGLAETISVAAEGARVQTQSGERSATISAAQ